MEILGISIIISVSIVCAAFLFHKKTSSPAQKDLSEVDDELKRVQFMHKLNMEKEKWLLTREAELRQLDMKKLEQEQSFELRKMELELKKDQYLIQVDTRKDTDATNFRREEMRLTFDLEGKKLEGAKNFSYPLLSSKRSYSPRW